MASLLVTLVLVFLTVGCAQAKPGASEAKAPEREGVRTLQRQPSSKIEVDESFFEPFMMARGAPSDLKSAYKSFIAGENKAARKGFEAFIKTQSGHKLAPKAAFLLAHLERRAGEHSAAADRFEAVSADYPLLADHARFYGARSAYQAGDHARTIKLCRAISMASPFGPRSRHLRAKALLASGSQDKAIEALESLQKDFPKASFIGHVKIDLGRAYEKVGRYVDAARLYHAIKTRYPGRSLERTALTGIRRVRPRLSRQQASQLLADTPRDRVLRASALNDAHRSNEVAAEMKKLIEDKNSGLKPGDEVWCDAAYLQGVALRKLRKHDVASAAYKIFLGDCPKGETYVKALFAAGRSHWTIDEDNKAFVLFERIWTEFPSHTYADDAVLYASRIRLGQGKKKAGADLLDFQVKHFPRGDMLGSAHWLRFKRRYESGAYKGAVDYVDAIGSKTGESDIYTRGRLHYFRARALEAQKSKRRAVQGYAKVARDNPMSYYALLAFNRLKALDEAVFEKTVADILDTERTRQTWTIEPPQLIEDSRFKRGVELLRLGLFADARLEFDRLRRGHAGHERLLWTLTLLFDRAGAYHLSHNIPRREIGTFGTSYPVGRDLDMFLLAYPQPFLKSARKWAGDREISESLVYAIMREESGFNPRIESWANAYGLMQLVLPTAVDMATADGLTRPKPRRLKGRDLFKPDLNIRLGSRYLATLFNAYGKHPAVTIAGYNGGFGNVDRWLNQRGKKPLDIWIEEIPFGQTRNYTKRVLTSQWAYQWLYGLPQSAEVKASDRLIHLPMKLPKASN